MAHLRPSSNLKIVYFLDITFNLIKNILNDLAKMTKHLITLMSTSTTSDQ